MRRKTLFTSFLKIKEKRNDKIHLIYVFFLKKRSKGNFTFLIYSFSQTIHKNIKHFDYKCWFSLS